MTHKLKNFLEYASSEDFSDNIVKKIAIEILENSKNKKLTFENKEIIRQWEEVLSPKRN